MSCSPAQQFVGHVKSFNPAKGWGHIECPDTFAVYGKDIFLLRSQLTNGAYSINKGTEVSFRISGDIGRGPEATEVSEFGVTNFCTGNVSTPSPDVGCGGGHAAPSGSMGGHEGNGVNSFVGIIKSFNPTSGWGHVACENTMQIYGKDIFFMKSQLPGGSISKGTTVRFAVGQGLKGPEARDIQPIGVAPGGASPHASPMWSPQQMPSQAPDPSQFPAIYQAMMAMMSGNAMGQAMQTQQHPAAALSLSPPNQGVQAQNQVDNQIFQGSIKSYSAEKGWGHIDCAKTRAMYGKDMFVLKSALKDCPGIAPGDRVSFSVRGGEKGPEACNVQSAGEGQVSGGGIETAYSGSVKQFDIEKGWGFIHCQQTRDAFQKDIFFHQKDLEGYVPVVGENVQFHVQISEAGRPEATFMSFDRATQSQGYGAATFEQFASVRAQPYGKSWMTEAID